MKRKQARWLDSPCQFVIQKLFWNEGVSMFQEMPFQGHSMHCERTLSMWTIRSCIPWYWIYNWRRSTNRTTFYRYIMKALQGDIPEQSVRRDKFIRLASLFHQHNGILLYQKEACVPQSSMKDGWHLAHASEVSGHFAFFKTVSRLDGYQWENETRDLKLYCKECFICRQHKTRRERSTLCLHR